MLIGVFLYIGIVDMVGFYREKGGESIQIRALRGERCKAILEFKVKGITRKS